MTASPKRLLTARPWLTAVVAVVVVGASTGTYLLSTGSDSSSAATGVTSRLVSVATGTVRESVSTTGTFTPADEEDVSFGSTAEITSVRVTQGQKVTKGQVLGTIDPLSLKASLAQAKADLATAEAQVASAEDSSDTTDAQLAADKANVTSAKTTVTDAQDALDDATLVSPISGTVAEVNVAVGDQSTGSSSSSSSSSGGGGSTQPSTGGGGATTTTTSSTSSTGDFVVIGMKKWTVSATVDDTQVGLLSKGDQVQITTDNVTGTVFGTVSSVSVLSSSDSGSASYPVDIAVTGAPTGLHDGASATISIIYKQVTNVLTVPTTAVHSDGSTSYVYVSKNGARTKTTVTTGLASGGTTQIKSGLTSGQQVYIETANLGNRGTSGSNSQTRQGEFPGGGTGNFPGGGTGNFPGGGAGNFGGGGNAP